MFASMGPWEWGIVLIIVVIVFGVGRLPEVGGALGRAINEFRQASKTEDGKEGETPAETKAA